MFCPKCGTKNFDTACFCTNCGNRLHADGLENDRAVHSKAEAPPTVALTNLAESVSQRTAEDRQSLHTYIVTPVSDYRNPSRQLDVSTGIANVATDLLGRDIGNLVGSIAGSVFGHLTGNKGVVSGSSVHDLEAETVKREALFQQKEILKLAAGYLERAPWITYLVATKCEAFLRHFGIATDSFPNLQEKQFVDEIERLADELEAKANQKMSQEDKANLQEMFHLESIRSQLEQAIQTLSSITHSEYRTFIESRLRGEGVSIPSRALEQSDGSVLRFIGKALLLSSAIWLLYLLLLNREPISSFHKLVWVALACLGFLVGGGVHDDGTKKRKLLNAALLAEERRVGSIETEIAEQCRRFGSDVRIHFPEIDLRVTDSSFTLEGVQTQFRQLIDRGEELKIRYTQT